MMIKLLRHGKTIKRSTAFHWPKCCIDNRLEVHRTSSMASAGAGNHSSFAELSFTDYRKLPIY